MTKTYTFKKAYQAGNREAQEGVMALPLRLDMSFLVYRGTQ